MSKVSLVAGLGFGDEGKGTITQYLAQENEAKLVVRYNGGCQAGHNVETDTGTHHTFAQFGSGTFEGVRTHLSRFMMVEPHALFMEGRHLVALGIPDPYGLLSIDREALLTTPYHWNANRLRELLRGDKKHGSCGMGIGETMNDVQIFGRDLVPQVGDLAVPSLLLGKLRNVRERRVEEFKDAELDSEIAKTLYARVCMPPEACIDHYSGMTDFLGLVDGQEFLKQNLTHYNAVFEGAQGVLLDQDFGFQPHTTWSDCTFANAITLLEEIGFKGLIDRVGVIRSYTTRHGAGPMVTETEVDPECIYDRHNGLSLTQGRFRVGPLDLPAIAYALEVIGGVDRLAVTHLDQRKWFSQVCSGYEMSPEDSEKFMDDRYELAVRRPINLKYQEELTKALFRAKADQGPMPSDEDGFLLLVRAWLNTPVKILSHGPRLRDKITRR